MGGGDIWKAAFGWAYLILAIVCLLVGLDNAFWSCLILGNIWLAAFSLQGRP